MQRSYRLPGSPWPVCLLLGVAFLGVCGPAFGQIPRINTFFPIGGKAGSKIEVEIRGSSLDGASTLLVHGRGVTGTVEPGDAKADETNRPLWQSKCSACHELRSPANRSMTPAQWVATVERMVKVRQAPISAAEQEKITAYLVGMAKAGKVTAQVQIAPDALPGLVEMRVATTHGISTAALFEVGNLPEVVAVPGKIDQPQPVTLPCVANGVLAGNGERHYFKFAAKKSQRLVFNLKGYRYRDASQMYFNPDLRLYDAQGKELEENHGYYELDPLIDWTCPADGDYTLEVRDLLGRGNPASVYRLTMGDLPYDTVLYPPAAQAGATSAERVVGKNTDGLQTAYSLPAQTEPGLMTASSPFGPHPFYVSSYPVVRDDGKSATATALPAGFAGHIATPGTAETFPIQGGGAYEFEAYTQRLGSPAHVRITLLNASGGGIAGMDGDGRGTATLEAGKQYTLKVEDTSGQGGADFVYFVEARPAHPGLECVARPDNVTLRAGLSTAIEVVLTRREGVDGDVQVGAADLPPGVSAAPAVIQPDRGEAWLILTAAPNATPSEKPIQITATAHGPAGTVTVPAIPQELYKLANDNHYVDRAECVVAVRGEADFTASVVSEPVIKVHPKEGVPVKLKVKRRTGFQGGITFQIVGLPSGWVSYAESIPANADEVTLLVRPDGNNPDPFLKRDPKWTPIHAVILGYSDEFQFVVATLPVAKADNITVSKND